MSTNTYNRKRSSHDAHCHPESENTVDELPPSFFPPKKARRDEPAILGVRTPSTHYREYIETEESALSVTSSSFTSSGSDRLDESWSARLDELRRYKATHGHCLVPKKSKSNPQLGIWVMNQRAQYKLLKEGKPSTMTSERIEALERLGFVWSLCDHVDWESRLEELRQYKESHGNCLVPNKYPANPQLGTWVNKQRTQYKLMKNGKPSSMTEKRVRALEALGFVWSKRDLVDWESRLEELRQYKFKYGDCLVPNKFAENPQLGTWVMHQRAQYRKWKEGKPSPMTSERVTALERIGFVWSISNVDVDWGARLEELRRFKQQNGHCRVPNKFPENPKLGTWVSKQRKQYKLLKEGKQSTLTSDRIRTLESMGFVWSLRSLVDWEARLDELRDYKAKHGDCLVPQQYPLNPQLGTWVSNQRKQYRLLKEGKPSPMNEERIRALENLGFVWSIFSHEDPWDAKLAELRSYKNKYGNCLVPDHFPENPHLAEWVKHQRRQHRLMQEGRLSAMTGERSRALENIGFVWTTPGGAESWEREYAGMNHSSKSGQSGHGHSHGHGHNHEQNHHNHNHGQSHGGSHGHSHSHSHSHRHGHSYMSPHTHSSSNVDMSACSSSYIDGKHPTPVRSSSYERYSGEVSGSVQIDSSVFDHQEQKDERSRHCSMTIQKEKELMRDETIFSLDDRKSPCLLAHPGRTHRESHNHAKEGVEFEMMREEDSMTLRPWEPLPHQDEVASCSSSSSITLSPSPSDWVELFDPIFMGGGGAAPPGNERKPPASFAWDAHIDAMYSSRSY